MIQKKAVRDKETSRDGTIISDGNSEHVVHACWKIGLFREIKSDFSPSNLMP